VIKQSEKKGVRMAANKQEKREYLRKQAEALLDADPSRLSEFQKKEAWDLVQELCVHQIELEIQNEELRRAQEELEAMRSRYSYLYHHAPAGYVVLDKVGVVVKTNRTFANMLNLEYTDIVGTHFGSSLSRTDEAIFRARYRSFFKNPANKSMELQFVKKNGKTFNGLVEALPNVIDKKVGDLYKEESAEELLVTVTDITSRKNAEQSLAREKAELQATLYGIGDAVIVTDKFGRVVRMNPVAEKLTGASESEDIGKPIQKVCPLVHEYTQKPVEHPVDRVLKTQKVVELANNVELITRTGAKLPVADSGAPIFNQAGEVTGTVMIFRDASEERLSRKYIEARLSLIEFAAEHTSDEFLTKALDIVGEFVKSPIGFYHLVHEDQETLTLQQWSTKTLETFCQAEAKGAHYPVKKAGVWTECIGVKKPVIHNDYKSLPNKKGMPKGHAEVVRELVVPVIRNDKIVAILGVGNKTENYTQQDSDIVAYLADVSWEILSKKRAEEQRRESEFNYRNLFQNMNTGVAIYVPDESGSTFTIADINKAGEEISGVKKADIVDRNILEVFPDMEELGLIDAIRDVHNTGTKKFIPIAKYKDSRIQQLIEYDIIKLPSGKIVVLFDDRTEQQHLEKRLRHSQKMEAIGHLAGGIAHDFNNILSGIIGFTDLALDAASPQSEQTENLEQVLSASDRAKKLVKQILSFSSGIQEKVEPVYIQPIVREICQFLRASTPVSIQIFADLEDEKFPIIADPGTIHEIVMNLSINAVSAMGEEGTLTIKNHNAALENEIRGVMGSISSGLYTVLSVSDTGHGIEPDVIEHIFEPFYTTKGLGEGTGMGLSVVFGIVQRCGGNIVVHTSKNTGTTFEIYLPQSKTATVKPLVEKKPAIPGGNERVLLLDDEELLSNLVETMLGKLGYQVTAFNDPHLALQKFQKSFGDFDLIITDQTMPDMNGFEFAKLCLEIRPDIPIILCTGYSKLIDENIVLNAGIKGYAMKPLRKKDLAAKIRSVLDK